MAVAEASSEQGSPIGTVALGPPNGRFVPSPGEHAFDVAYPAYIREKARSMRIERRLTLDQLAERLALPRSTIYHWVRDLPIPGSGPGGQWPESARRKGTRAMQRKYRLLREAAYREGL